MPIATTVGSWREASRASPASGSSRSRGGADNRFRGVAG